jgi:hypothetical protein
LAQTPADTAPIAPPPRESFKPRLIRWFYEGYTEPGKPHARPAHTAPWWKVMCLTGVDYFSTLAYQPKFLAFGEGDTAPVTREVLRQFEPDPQRRPRVHVG